MILGTVIILRIIISPVHTAQWALGTHLLHKRTEDLKFLIGYFPILEAFRNLLLGAREGMLYFPVYMSVGAIPSTTYRELKGSGSAQEVLLQESGSLSVRSFFTDSNLARVHHHRGHQGTSCRPRTFAQGNFPGVTKSSGTFWNGQ